MKAVFCTPTYTKPHPAFLKAMEESVPALDAAGIDHSMVFEVGSPYISCARATMLRKALTAGAEIIVFLDHDLSWRPEDLVKLVETEGHVVAGTYRYKTPDEEKYMGVWACDDDLRPFLREDGCIHANAVPAGFLKVTNGAVAKFMRDYPELVFGPPFLPSVDLFNHGAIGGLWFGEDYAFSKRWNEGGGKIWLIPDLDINHHHEQEIYPGNLHEYLLRQPGGSHENQPLKRAV